MYQASRRAREVLSTTFLAARLHHLLCGLSCCVTQGSSCCHHPEARAPQAGKHVQHEGLGVRRLASGLIVSKPMTSMVLTSLT